MYATSKLIIPPKPARNIPYIPKLRIKLRPSVIKGRVLTSAKQDALRSTVNNGKDVTDNDLKDTYIYSRFMNGESRQSDNSQVLNRDEPDGSNEDSVPSKVRVSGTLFKRASGRKQNIILEEDIDLDGPESILTKINLKAIINRETFYALPVEAQRMLADLLPVYDRNKHTWSSFTGLDTGPDAAKHTSSSPESSIPNDDSSVWLHPSALSNEFFGKALQDYASRQAQGDFAPRVRNRAGLRASASGRCRYLLPTSIESPYERVSTRSFPCNSTPRLNHVRRTTANRAKSSALSLQPNGDVRKRKLVSNRLQSASGETASIPKLKLKKTNGTKLAKFDDIRKSRRSGRFSQQQVADSTSITTDSIASESHEAVSDIRERYASGTESTMPTDNVALAERLMESSEVKLPSPIVVCGIQTTEFTSTSRLSSPSTQTHSSTENESPQKRARKLSGVSQSPTLLQTPAADTKYISPLGSPRPTRVSRTLSSTLDTPASSPMPPPRQTKTLAAVREKLRAKRMLKEAERKSPSQSYYSLPGSMTPHPASGASGYFHQPSSYPSNVGFGVLSTENTKRSSSALSSPRLLESLSPRPCDKQVTTNNNTIPVTLNTLLHSVPENDPSKVPSASPASPCSLPNAELLSPLPNLCLTTELPSFLGDQDHAAFNLDFAAQSYPSSPHSSISPLVTNGSLSFDPARSPQSARENILPYNYEYPPEQSTSAPPTPSTHQSGQTQRCSMSNISLFSTLATGIASNNASLMENSLTAVSLPNSTVPVSSRSTSLNAALSTDAGDIQPVQFSHSIDLPGTGNPVDGAISHIGLQPFVTGLSPLCSSQSLPSLYPSSSANSPVPSQSFQSTPSQAKLPRDTTQSTTIPRTTVSPLIPSAVSQLLVGSGTNSNNNKPSTTTRAFFVDGDNLSQALALLQSLNPKATITQQQFLLIPSANKSQMFLLRPPASKSPATSASQPSTPLSVSASQSSSPSTVNLVRQTVNSTAASPTTPSCSYSGDFRPMFDAQPVSSPSSTVTFVTGVSNQILSRTLSTPGGEGVAVPVNIRPRLAPTETAVSVYQNLSTAPPPPAPPPPHPRAVVCSTSSLSSPALLQLKSQSHARPISTVDLDQDRIGLKPRSVSPKIALPPVHNNKVSAPTATVLCANPTAQSQITLSLLTSSPSLLSNETPLVLLTDSLRAAPSAVHQNTRQVSLLQANMVEQAYSIYTQSSPGNTPLLTPSPVTVINPSSSSLSLGAPPIPTVPNPSFYTNSFSTLSREPTMPQYTTTICGNKFVTADQLSTVIQTNPMNCYPTTMVQTLPVSYLPAATIVSHCSPALVFPHTMQALHPNQTHLVSRDNGTQFSRPSV